MPVALVMLIVTISLVALSGCRLQDRPNGDNVITIGPVQLNQPTDEQQVMLAEAQGLRNAGEYENALALFRQILAENPTITTAYLGIGDIHMVNEDYEKAEPVYARAARLEPQNFEAQYGHGLALQMLGRFIEAVRAYQRAISIDPDNPEANANLATTYLRLEQVQDALDYAERAVELNPENGSARVNLGAIYQQLGRNAEAIDQYLAAVELLDDPENAAPVMVNLIDVLARENRYREAANTAENLIRIEPSANAYERLGWAHFRLKNYQRSMVAYEEAVDLDPRHWPSLNGIGINALNLWLLSDRSDEPAKRRARDAFRRSLQINDDQPRLVQLMLTYGLK